MLLRLLKSLYSPKLKERAEEEQPLSALDGLVQEGYALKQAGSPQAEVVLRRVLAGDPKHVDALCLLAEIHLARGEDEAAGQLYIRALKQKPGIPAAYVSLAQISFRRGQHGEAMKCLNKLAGLPGLDAANFNNMGVLWLGMNDYSRAETSFRAALAADPRYAFAWCNLGIVLQHSGDFSGALECFQHTQEITPEFAEGLHNQALLLRDLGRPAEALALLQRAIELKPDYAMAYANLGVAYQDLGDIEEALTAFDSSLALDPDCGDVRVTKAQLLLSLGCFREGWQDHERRLSIKGSPRERFPFPEWNGSDLKGQTLLVYAEQGLGDEIMFASCLPDLLTKTDRCVVECDPKLEAVFRRSFPQATIVGNRFRKVASWLRELPPIDCQVAEGSLPRFFRNDWEDFPHHSGYLIPDPERVAHWRDRLEVLGPGLKIGLSWRGGTTKTLGYLRSIPLRDWWPILEQTPVHFVNLQYTDCGEELFAVAQELGVEIHDWQSMAADYEETVALVASLDLVISVCTAVVHLAGALGTPAWVMVPSAPGWRYMREGGELAWYPSVRLFRQQAPLCWEPVIAEVAAELDGRLKTQFKRSEAALEVE